MPDPRGPATRAISARWRVASGAGLGRPTGPYSCTEREADRRPDPRSSAIESKSALALLVARILADDANDALAAHDLALVADLLDGRTDLHDLTPEYVRGSNRGEDPADPGPENYLWRYVIRPRLGS